MFATKSRESSKEKAGVDGTRTKPQAKPLEAPNLLWHQLAIHLPFSVKRQSGALPPPIQPKLAVSQPGDPYEQEADRVAEQVMRMPVPTVQRTCAMCADSSAPCPQCEDSQRGPVQRKVERDSNSAPESVSDSIMAGFGSGRPLDASTRLFMESRFGQDFRHVRVHTDDRAEKSAQAANALAYTLGNSVVFAPGRYSPHTTAGRRLLSHELTHVLQQRGAGVRVQRQTGDFRVTQVQPDPQRRTQGMADRFFFELDQSDFRADVPAEAAERTRLESWATAHAGQHVRLIGRASQEGSLAHNRELAQQRAATVRSVLVAGGVIVDGAPQIDMTFSQRPVDYRFYRSVEVIVAGSTDVTCNTFTPTQQSQDETDCETAFSAALARAVGIANAGIERIRPATDPASTPAPDRDSVLNGRFRGVARATLLPRFESVVTRLGQVGPAAGHVCNHRCASGCERPAEASAGGPVRLCASFYIPGFRGRTMSADERVFAVMHETTHSAVVPGSTPPESIGIDFAYSTTRLFGALEGSEALRNTDSYVVTLLTLARTTEGAPAILAARGVGPADSLSLTTPVGESGDRNRTARRAIGFAESWLNYASFWSPDLYDFIAASLAAWDAAALSGTGHLLVEAFAPLFQLQHPGTAALDATDRPRLIAFQTEVAGRGFPTPPIASRAQVQDRTRAAGIYDRLTRMHRRLSSPLTVDQAASGDGSWSAETGLPGLGTEVHLPNSFFALSASEQTRHVIRLMARAMTDVGATWVEAYVEAADGVHRIRGLGP